MAKQLIRLPSVTRLQVQDMKPTDLLGGRPVAVIGAGLVGAGWAIVFAQAGLEVRVYEAVPAPSTGLSL